MVESYDPTADTWSKKASMLQPRCLHAAVTVNGKLYVIGGVDSKGNDSAAVEVYDSGSDTWTSKAPMPTARRLLAAVEAYGIIYAIGGQTVRAQPPNHSCTSSQECATGSVCVNGQCQADSSD